VRTRQLTRNGIEDLLGEIAVVVHSHLNAVGYRLPHPEAHRRPLVQVQLRLALDIHAVHDDLGDILFDCVSDGVRHRGPEERDIEVVERILPVELDAVVEIRSGFPHNDGNPERIHFLDEAFSPDIHINVHGVHEVQAVQIRLVLVPLVDTPNLVVQPLGFVPRGQGADQNDATGSLYVAV